ncbi:hypothetical protein C3920_15950, partial [Novacetimonas pomaceti]
SASSGNRYQADIDPTRLAFIDETAVSTKMARLRGRSCRGTRCRMSVPHRHRKTTTFIGRVAPRTIAALQDAVCGAIDDVCHSRAAACFTGIGYEPDYWIML